MASPTDSPSPDLRPPSPLRAGERAVPPTEPGEVSPGAPTHRRTAYWLLVLLPLAYLWFRLFNNLRIEWSTNPQYAYGWVVPFLSLGLLLRRWPDRPTDAPATDAPPTVLWPLTFALLAFLYLPTRLIEGATPEWRPIQWMLGFEAIGLTLVAIYLLKGWAWVRHFAFPICFIFVAIPWPTLIEIPVIQWLTRLNATMVVEIMGLLGVPAVQHGNLLEVGTGMLGIEEACSGIRSFQSSVMISLFIGEFYRFKWLRRLLFVLAGFLLAIGFNVVRSSFLTYVAAKQGTGAIAQYHDPAGFLIVLACTAVMWLLAFLLHRRPAAVASASVASTSVGGGTGGSAGAEMEDGRGKIVGPTHRRTDALPTGPGPQPQVSGFIPHPSLYRLSLTLLIWLLAVEAGVVLWYRSREAKIKPGPAWSVAFPKDNSSFKALPMDDKTRDLLRFDDFQQGEWREADGVRVMAFYFNWLPGRVAGYLAKRHTPDICMPATGRDQRGAPEMNVLTVHGVDLPVRSYVFGEPGRTLQVYHCRWEAGATRDAYTAYESGRFNLIRGIWAGRGNHGQKVIEIILSGVEDPQEAKTILVQQLEKIVRVEDGR